MADTWSDYMREHGTEEYAAWEAAVKPYTERIAALTQQLADSEAARDELSDKLMASNRRCAEAEKKLAMIEQSAVELAATIREQWNIPADVSAFQLYCASLLVGFSLAWKEAAPQNGFVTSAIFPDVGRLEIYIRKIDGKGTAEVVTELRQERDSALAIARQAVEVMEQVEWSSFTVTDLGNEFHFCPLCDQVKEKGHAPDCPVGAFLLRPDVVKIGGGK